LEAWGICVIPISLAASRCRDACLLPSILALFERFPSVFKPPIPRQWTLPRCIRCKTRLRHPLRLNARRRGHDTASPYITPVLCFGTIKRKFRVEGVEKAALGSKFQSVSLGAARMVRYAGRSTSAALDPEADFFKLGSTLQAEVIQVSHGGQEMWFIARGQRGHDRPCNTGQVSLFGAVERSDIANPTQISSVLSVTPLFAPTLQILLANELDVLCIRNKIESLRMNVDLALHGEEGRPRKRVTPTKSYGYGQVPVTQQW
jgi:hypothetical protein